MYSAIMYSYLHSSGMFFCIITEWSFVQVHSKPTYEKVSTITVKCNMHTQTLHTLQAKASIVKYIIAEHLLYKEDGKNSSHFSGPMIKVL